MWCNVVWREKEKEMEHVVPRNWIQNKKNKPGQVLRWPPKRDVEQDMKNMVDPQSDWAFFDVLKMKKVAGIYCGIL